MILGIFEDGFLFVAIFSGRFEDLRFGHPFVPFLVPRRVMDEISAGQANDETANSGYGQSKSMLTSRHKPPAFLHPLHRDFPAGVPDVFGSFGGVDFDYFGVVEDAHVITQHQFIDGEFGGEGRRLHLRRPRLGRHATGRWRRGYVVE